MQKCLTCGGKGKANSVYVNDSTGHCPECHGTGVAPDKQQSELEDIEVRCDACGSGSYLESHAQTLTAIQALIRRREAEAVREALERVKERLHDLPRHRCCP